MINNDVTYKIFGDAVWWPSAKIFASEKGERGGIVNVQEVQPLGGNNDAWLLTRARCSLAMIP